ncbi:MAG TPA: hypothetical protein VLC98_12650 [Phnomibacter sp.]|nr:hypothetical protein [Phnomibacter sp.]
MRKVDRASIATPAALTNANCINHLTQINGNPDGIKASKDIYKGRLVNPDNSSSNTVTIALKGLYNNKCAYCEKLCHYPRVEHFRPKGRVTGNQPLANGYYWLCYEWTNLLPSCHECNSVEAKGDRFPIKAIRKSTFPITGNPPVFDAAQNIFDSAYLTDEDPYYIHPEYCDDFWLHFDFERDGKIVGVSDYGQRTIADLKLDDEDRNGWRREIYESYFNRLLKLVRRYKRTLNPITDAIFDEELDGIIREIVCTSEDKFVSYTLFRKALVKKIEYFFVEPLDPVFRVEMINKIVQSLLKLAKM